jgi:dihydrofolate synthase / folylpolyglutamate synthase
MNRYKAALDYLYTQLPMFQRTGPAAYKHSLGNTLLLDAIYRHPHHKFKSLHIAGTNGKGSVSHMLAAILQSAGYRTGLYTSPHLKDFRERIRIDGKMISEDFVADWTEDFQNINLNAGVEPSFFELTVAMAFDYFAKEEVDIAVVEVGLGGRLDSTNIITPEIGIITNISYDHTSLLGETLPLIAAEKAGIIKPGTPVVISQRQKDVESVFIRKAEELNSPIFFASDEYSSDYGLSDFSGNQVLNFRKQGALIYPSLKTDLPGNYQRLNIPAVLKTIDLMREKGWLIPDEFVYSGLQDVKKLTGLQGRWQVLGANPRIVCDTGHNEEGIRMVTEQIKQVPCRVLHIVFGVVSDKDPEKVLALLPKQAVYYFCKAEIPRALDENLLKERGALHGLMGSAFSTVDEAYSAAKLAAGPDDFIFVGGSTFVVAEIL